ncbi:carbamoyl phosphate synthase small subunit [Bacillus safensis FO-36b] [Bacillus safensis subsp. safensis]
MQANLLRGAFAGPDEQVEDVVRRLQTLQLPTDQVSQVSVKNAYPSPGRGKRIVLVDFGIEACGILRELNKRDCDVIVVPYNITADEVLQLKR